MRIRNKAIAGKIGESGELVAHWDRLSDFLIGHKGKNVLIRVEVQSKEPSEATRNYFFGYIVPELRQAYLEFGEHLTKEQTYNRIRDNCPFFLLEERKDGEWRRVIRDFEELDQAEMNEAIEWTIQWAAENFYLILDYPQ